jgi:hypothetical protein
MVVVPARIAPEDRGNWFWPRRITGTRSDVQAKIELAVCTGVQLAHRHPGGDKGYSPDAYVPCGAWENIAYIPRTNARAGNSSRGAPRCGVFQVPGFDQALWLQIAERKQADADCFDRAINRLTDAIVSDAYSLFGASIPPVVHGVNTNEGNELTVTIDQDTGRRVGLHVDSWDGGGIAAREQTLTRLCINLGPGARYFLYVPLTLRQIALCLPGVVRRQCADNVKLLTREFFRQNPNAAIMRLLVRPGCGYFADTDNIIHDASTMSVSLGNTHFTMRGRFNLLN